MQQQKLNSSPAALHAVTKAIGGATEHGAAIGLKQNDAASLTAKKTGLLATEAALDGARAELKTRKATLKSVSSTVTAFITLARDVLKPRLGSQYSTAWEAVGFVGSLELPRNVEQLKFKLQKLVSYLTANPDAENAGLNITLARAQSLLDELILKENAVTSQYTAVSNAVQARKEALKAVIRAIGNLATELRGLIGSLDPVYTSFGLLRPGAKAIPAIPLNLIAVLVGPAAVALKWDRAERAERYRVWKKVIGVDDAMVAVESREDLDFVLENLPSGKSIQIAVSAVNNGGESELSAVVTVVTP